MRCSDKKFTLKAPNGKYVASYNDYLFADNDEKTPKGIFVFEKQDIWTGLFVIYAKERREKTGQGYWVGSNGAYGWCIQPRGTWGSGNNHWQKFQVLNQDDGSVVFKTIHGKYVNLETWSGHQRLVGKSDSINEDTKFTVECA